MTQEKVKAYTDIEQSRKLAEILPLESADSYYSWHDERYYVVNKDCPYPYSLKEKTPCWSLTALMDVLDRGALFKTPRGWICQAYAESKAITSNYHSNPIDSCYEMILELHKLKLL